jgi:predicted TIM-barrel fold metal-dependent hydrolase
LSVIDVHTHVWPDSIAAKALAHSIPDLPQVGDGRVASLVRTMDETGIDRAVCLGVAITPDQVELANKFAGALDRSRFVGFGSVHAELGAEENVASLRRHGLVGAKVHPLFQGYGLDHPGLLETLELMEGEFIVLAHVGAGGSGGVNRGCTPELLRALVERFPRLDLIAAHFGGYRMIDEAEETVIGLPVYLDTAWPPTVGAIDAEKLRGLIERHGHERVLFASDWPMADPAKEMAAFRSLGLDDDQVADILGRNMEKLLARYGA